MIEEKLLISYLKKQKREYNEQVVILQKELTSSLMYNHRQEYIIKNLMYESMMNVIRIYENLIEKIKNGEFDKVKKNIHFSTKLCSSFCGKIYKTFK